MQERGVCRIVAVDISSGRFNGGRRLKLIVEQIMMTMLGLSDSGFASAAIGLFILILVAVLDW
jgi:hypothetical protein